MILLVSLPFAVAGLVCLWLAWDRSMCYVCRIRHASLELGDYPVCRGCWDRIERCRHITEGLLSTTADEEIREYRRTHPKAQVSE